MFPADPSMWVPKKKMRRHHYLHGRKHVCIPTVLAELHRMFREESVELAKGLGLFDVDGPGSLTHPDPSRGIYSDGKVVTPFLTATEGTTRIDKKTGERVQVRYDPDSSYHVEGGDHDATGTKYVITSTRTEDDRIILVVSHVPKSGRGGEAGIAMEAFADIIPLAPGILYVVYDMALRGMHLERLMTDLGVLGLAKVQSAQRRVRRHEKGGFRKAKHVPIKTKTITRADGSEVTVQLVSDGGVLGIDVLDDTGHETFIPLERIRIQRPTETGPNRFYAQYKLPEEYESKEITVRLNAAPGDKRQKLNRAEVLRAIPWSDPDFERLYGPARADTEGRHRGLEDTLYWQRAHSIGHVRPEIDLLGWGLMVNALAYARHRAREGISTAA
jgi:hypothetical protein